MMSDFCFDVSYCVAIHSFRSVTKNKGDSFYIHNPNLIINFIFYCSSKKHEELIKALNRGDYVSAYTLTQYKY